MDWLDRCKQPPRVLVSGSATGQYGDQGQEPLDRDGRAGKDDSDSQLCVAWKEEAHHAEALDVRVVLLRTVPVLTSDGGMLPRLRLPSSMGLDGRLGNGRQWMPWIHLDDMVGLIDFLLHHADYWSIFNACAPDLVRNADFASTLATALRRSMFLSVPTWVLRMALGEMSVLLLDSQHPQPRRTLETGYHFHFPNLGKALAGLLVQDEHLIAR